MLPNNLANNIFMFVEFKTSTKISIGSKQNE